MGQPPGPTTRPWIHTQPTTDPLSARGATTRPRHGLYRCVPRQPPRHCVASRPSGRVKVEEPASMSLRNSSVVADATALPNGTAATACARHPRTTGNRHLPAV